MQDTDKLFPFQLAKFVINLLSNARVGGIWDTRKPPVLLVVMGTGQLPRRATGQDLFKRCVCVDAGLRIPLVGDLRKNLCMNPEEDIDANV